LGDRHWKKIIHLKEWWQFNLDDASFCARLAGAAGFSHPGKSATRPPPAAPNLAGLSDIASAFPFLPASQNSATANRIYCKCLVLPAAGV
jgi:hypothetical protein